MTAQPHLTIAAARTDRFADIPASAAGHFQLALLGVIARIIESVVNADRETTLQAYPFLADYAAEIEGCLTDPAAPAWKRWRTAVRGWEHDHRHLHLPLRALGDAGLDLLDLDLLLIAGLAEEDPRFADLFAAVTGGERWPTAGLLLAWCRCDEDGSDRPESVRRSLARLVRTGLLQVGNPLAPRPEWALRVPAPLWDALRGEPPSLSWLGFRPLEQLLPLEEYIAPPPLAARCRTLPHVCLHAPSPLLIVRGPQQNGRKTLVGSIAHSLARNLLIAESAVAANDALWSQLGALAVALNALPVIEIGLAPGETRTLPSLPLSQSPLAVVTGTRGAILTSDDRPVLAVDLPLPDVGSRRAHWQAVAAAQPERLLDELARSSPLTSGVIRRVGRSARLYAAAEGRSTLCRSDVRAACRTISLSRLETLARRIDARGSLADLAVDDVTRNELEALIARCQHREALARALAGIAADEGIGVRALLAGGSGTGKTLAARLLAATLEKDLYRVDLSATVNKYLGETEKNLDEALSAAEELDVVLLLDEGDALMTHRTDVGSSNDRYANLETNFLLQRIEDFNGILVITTNAMDRVDRAFVRRMDVVIHFRAPDEFRRYDILCLHLREHAVDDAWLQEAAIRCQLTGGQLRNVAAHAQLLALEGKRPAGRVELYAAFAREYRKSGAHCPLSQPAAQGTP